MQTGRLRIYLGAAPGVGKTHALFDEGIRRMGRGNSVVLAAFEDSDRATLNELAQGFERVGLLNDVAAGISALITRNPDVVLIDDLAATCARSPELLSGIRELLSRGIDVIVTLNIVDIESMNGAVTEATGMASLYVIPEEFLREHAQVELIDMNPHALRRRLAHGHIYSPDEVDPATANVFRLESLTLLRQLALQWTLEHAEDELLAATRSDPDPIANRTPERVVVALGGEGGDELVRRAARIARTERGHLIGVHIMNPARPSGPDLERQRTLLRSLGGTYREVVSDDVTEALETFLRVEHATHVVIGARPTAFGPRRPPTLANRLIQHITTATVHVIPTGVTVARPPVLVRPPRVRSWHLVLSAWLLCLVGLPAVTIISSSARSHVSLGSALLADLCVIMGIAALGGIVPGLVASMIAFGLANWFLTPPLHTLAISEPENVVAFTVFVIVTVVVSLLVDRVARRSREARTARAEAGALARSAATLVGAHDPLPELVEHIRTTFSLESVSVLERHGDTWWPTTTSGTPTLTDPSHGTSINISPDGGLQLVMLGDALHAEQVEILRAFLDQLSLAIEARRLRAEAANLDLIEEADALRSALLQAVSHDFRTPLATIKAAATGLIHSGDAIRSDDRTQLLSDIGSAADLLDRMVRDLLDMSRLQAGALERRLVPVALEEVTAAALAAVPPAKGRVVVDVPDSLPMVFADFALLERAVANLVSNAVAWSPQDTPVRIEAGQIGTTIDLRIIDQGPGIPMMQRDRMFTPFQRLGDRSNDAGAGLGLAIAKGFIEAIGAELAVDDTPGGGLTITIRLPISEPVGA